MAVATPQSEAQAASGPEGDARPANQALVLSRDPALLQVLQDVVANDDLVFLSDEAALARHLLEGRVGVVLLDIETLGTGLAQLAGKLHAQLPDLALIAAGTTQDEPALAPLLTAGVIHRFLHKPVSAQRVKLFIEAAWRRHESAVSGTWPALPQLPEAAAKAPLGLLPRVAIGTLVTVVAGIVWFSVRLGESQPQAPAPRHPASGDGSTPRPAIGEAPVRTHLFPAPAPLLQVHLSAPRLPPLTPQALNLAVPAPTPTAPPTPPATKVATGDNARQKPISALLLNKTRFVNPVYPLAARGHDDNGGLVDLEFTVRADGSVTGIVVTRATPPGVYEAAAVDAVRQWRYEPIQRDGHAVDQRVYLELRFAYRDPAEQ